MSILIEGATIVAMDPEHGSEPFQGDILIEGERIAAVGETGPEVQADRVIEGAGKLVIPGLVNAHIHTPEAFAKGRYDNMPLELWMTLAYGILGEAELTPRMIYLRSALCAMDAIKTGVTFFSDDILEFPLQSMETIGAVFDAYEDVGLRASVSGHVIDRKLPDSIVYLNDHLPADLKREVDEMVPPSADEFSAFCEEALARYHDRAGRLRFMPAPSGPQRCTEPLMRAADAFARENGVPFHTHILESKVAGGHRPRALRQDADPLHARPRPAHPPHHHRAWHLAHRRRHRADGRGALLGGAQRALQPQAGAPASARCAGCWIPASTSRSAPTASPPATRRACSA